MSPSASKHSRAKKKQSLERSFLTVFQTIRRGLKFESATLDALADSVLDTLVQAAASKCVDFNIAANRSGRSAPQAFVLMSNLRGICEDLIYLTFLSRIESDKANELLTLLLKQNTAKALHAQRNFFAANNPFQPVLGGGMSAEEVDKLVTEARDALRAFWRRLGRQRRDGPTILQLAEEVGLTSTYEYIYFASSNFVHFNPQALLRMGWGPESGPFAFSIENMEGYYRAHSCFYGAILFVGFHAAFGAKYFKGEIDGEIERLLELLGHVQRWPEVLTFEEMNQKPPLYLLTHALGEMMREEDKTLPYGAILQEVRSLRPANDGH